MRVQVVELRKIVNSKAVLCSDMLTNVKTLLDLSAQTVENSKDAMCLKAEI